MHDGLRVTITDVIVRHANQAKAARNHFNALGAANQADELAFIFSL